MKLLTLIFATCIQFGDADWSGMEAKFYNCEDGYKLTTLTRQQQTHPLFYITDNGKEAITWKNLEEDGYTRNATIYARIVGKDINIEK